MGNLFRIPKMQMALVLLLVFLTSLINYKSPELATFFVAALSLTVILDLALLKLRKIDLFLPSAALISGSIIGLTASPNLNFFQLSFLCLLAVFSKQFLRINKKHIFNPAAFGLFFAHILFRQDVSWWGASFQQLRFQDIESITYFLVLLSAGYVSFYKMRKYGIILSFLAIYFLLSGFSLKTVFDPTVLFFSLVMLPEPMTTPVRTIRQILFGSFVAAMVFLPFMLNLPDVFIFSLLIGNLLFFKFK